ncbi:hypothetical protein BDP27DRAFT_1336840 [Rhodocollybia butyracea]|uniref:Uncharacterized protein n=1 Tax=Rhodocollybia butyracea TaxID=206335 RepID=A0A9P5PEC1_9AGAR|nr:hypothetical protein BDP27DRAFT_1336840 [Rhodocollybia butyracea]
MRRPQILVLISPYTQARFNDVSSMDPVHTRPIYEPVFLTLVKGRHYRDMFRETARVLSPFLLEERSPLHMATLGAPAEDERLSVHFRLHRIDQDRINPEAFQVTISPHNHYQQHTTYMMTLESSNRSTRASSSLENLLLSTQTEVEDMYNQITHETYGIQRPILICIIIS